MIFKSPLHSRWFLITVAKSCFSHTAWWHSAHINWQVCAIRVPNAIKSQIASWEETASNHTNSVLEEVWTFPSSVIFYLRDSEFSVFLLPSHCHQVNISLIARLSRKIKNVHSNRGAACSRGSSTEKWTLSGIVWDCMDDVLQWSWRQQSGQAMGWSSSWRKCRRAVRVGLVQVCDLFVFVFYRFPMMPFSLHAGTLQVYIREYKCLQGKYEATSNSWLA